MISAPSFFLFLFLTAHSCLHPPGHFDVDVNLKGTFTNGNVSHIRVLPGNLGGGECHSRGNALIFFSRQSKGRDGRPPCSCAAEERSQENHPRETTDSEERGKQRESRRAGEQERRAAGSSPLRQGMAKSPQGRTDRRASCHHQTCWESNWNSGKGAQVLQCGQSRSPLSPPKSAFVSSLNTGLTLSPLCFISPIILHAVMKEIPK